MNTSYYSAAKTLWKAIKASGIMGSGAAAALVFPDENADIFQWIIFAATLIPLVWVPLRNWWMHSSKPTKAQIAEVERYIQRGCIILVLGVSLAFLSSGCTSFGQSRVSTVFEETVSPEGVATTRFKADSRGEVDASLHKMNYRWGGEENQIVVGQESAGITSPAQQAFIEGIAQLIGNIPGMWEALMGAVSKPTSVASPGTP